MDKRKLQGWVGTLAVLLCRYRCPDPNRAGGLRGSADHGRCSGSSSSSCGWLRSLSEELERKKRGSWRCGLCSFLASIQNQRGQ